MKPSSFDGGCIEGSFADLKKNETINGPMMLANNGYDVWLMSMRGTDWSLDHHDLSSEKPEFWDYCLDDFALSDIPAVIDYIRDTTGAQKVGYIGHSQATFSIFALMSTRPDYADIVEPVIAVAPVAFFDGITSIARLLFMSTLTATNNSNNGPFPLRAKSIRSTLVDICDEGQKFQKLACQLITTLISGFGKNWPDGYYNHLLFHTSLKVLRHFGQLIKFKRFAMYDYGKTENLKRYGKEQSPSYLIENIRSKSICLISTKTDALSPPKDVEKFRKRLKVPLYRDIFIDKDFSHFDLITDGESAELVFQPILEILETIEQQSGYCSSQLDAGSDDSTANNLVLEQENDF